jgi:hypothetical protein
MAIENIDLSQEIESWKSAVRGKDVRAANVAAFEKIQGTVNDTVQNVNQAAEDSASAAHNAQAAVDSIQAAIATATEKAAAAATSATQAAGSQAAADSSKTAAAQSETNAAASAAEARQIAEGFGGFDGTAASVTATDTYGLVVAALGESTTQALIDAIANKVINELVAKSQIINNLLATVPGNALDAVQGKKLMDLYTRLNGEIETIARENTISDINFLPQGLSCGITDNNTKNKPLGWTALRILIISYVVSNYYVTFASNMDTSELAYRAYPTGWRTL